MISGFSYRLPFGANLIDPTRTSFSLWAPAKNDVTLEIDGIEPISMQRQSSGMFVAEAPCGAGARYRYRIDEELTVPDPASRAQAADVHGYSVVVDPLAYQWNNTNWCGRPWHEAVIYELHAGCYGGQEGAFSGIADRLKQLADLGITAIELMPVADFSGKRNWGYDGVLPYAPSGAYGTPADLKALIDSVHGLGMCIYLDVVYNHFGPDGNYLSAYAPSFFDDTRSSPWGPSINFSVPEVREFFIHNALYWLMEYRFDGLRFDAVHAIGHEDFVVELGRKIRDGTEPHRHIHLMLENEDNIASYLSESYDAQWNDDAHNAIHVLLTGEQSGYYADFADKPASRLARCLAEGFSYQGDPSPVHGGEPRGTPSAHLAPSAFILFLQNHDQIGNRALGERLTVLADPEALEAAIALQLLSPQIPLLFMGEEWGAEAPFLFFTDFRGELARAVRDGRRREFSAFDSFSSEAGRRLIPDPNAIGSFMKSRLDSIGSHAEPEQATRRRLYQNLLALRRDAIVPRIPESRSLGATNAGPHSLIATWRLGDGSRLCIATNLGPLDVKASPSGSLGDRILFTTSDKGGRAAHAGLLLKRSTTVFLDES